MDGRFQNESSPKLDRFVAKITKSGELIVGKSIIQFVEVAKRGRLSGKLIYKKEYRR